MKATTVIAAAAALLLLSKRRARPLVSNAEPVSRLQPPRQTQLSVAIRPKDAPPPGRRIIRPDRLPGPGAITCRMATIEAGQAVEFGPGSIFAWVIRCWVTKESVAMELEDALNLGLPPHHVSQCSQA